jgi:hypothetical protein
MVPYRAVIRVPPFLVAVALGVALACTESDRADSAAREWRVVLDVKRAAQEAPSENQQTARQAYADAVANFLARNPTHARAAEVYEGLVFEQAGELTANARYDAAVELYQWLLARNPGNEAARDGLARAMDRRSVTREEVGALRLGMTEVDVRIRLGSPLPGWSRTMRRGERTIDAWYYARPGGGVAGVFFDRGRVFAAEFDGPVALESGR